jgi:streptogramin lyase
MIVGEGRYRYRLVDSDWGKLPEGWTWNRMPEPGSSGRFEEPVSVAVDSTDRVFVRSRSDHPLTVFDKEGKFLASWGEEVLDKQGAHGVYVDAEDNVYCAELSHCIRKFNKEGELVMTLGTPGRASERDGVPFNEPTDVAVSSCGDIFVSDGYKNHNVHRFSPEGQYISTFGEKGIDPGTFSNVHCVRIDRHDRIWTCDRPNTRIQIFDLEGRFLREMTGLPKPQALYFDPHEEIVYVAELWQVSIYCLTGELLTKWGGVKQSSEPGGFIGAPHGIWGDSEGSLYITESGAKGRGRVQKFARIQKRMVTG